MTEEEKRRKIIEIFDENDERRSKEIDEYIKKHNLIPVPWSGDPDEECRKWFRKWWKENNMTPEKYNKIILDIINKYAEQGENNE